MNLVKRILVVCTIEVSCEELVQAAATFAGALEAELFVLTVIYDPFGMKGLSFPRPSLAKDFQNLIQKIRRDMNQIANREKYPDIAITSLIRQGKPVNVISNVIVQEKIDLLVLPAHEETPLEHFLFGKRNRILFRKLPCSLLFIKKEPTAIPEEEKQTEEENGDE